MFYKLMLTDGNGAYLKTPFIEKSESKWSHDWFETIEEVLNHFEKTNNEVISDLEDKIAWRKEMHEQAISAIGRQREIEAFPSTVIDGDSEPLEYPVKIIYDKNEGYLIRLDDDWGYRIIRTNPDKTFEDTLANHGYYFNDN